MATRRIELPNGNIEYRNEFGELHNHKGWAKETSNGSKESYVNGQLHSIGDNPAIVTPLGGYRTYYKYGKLHRDEDKPAYIVNGIRRWYKDGIQHTPSNPKYDYR